jgi:hypothetical protein
MSSGLLSFLPPLRFPEDKQEFLLRSFILALIYVVGMLLLQFMLYTLYYIFGVSRLFRVDLGLSFSS